MKQEKVFVRYKTFNEAPPHNRQRTEKRPYDKKKYAQKNNRPRQALKIIYDSYQAVTQTPPIINKLIAIYPKFFNKEERPPEKENNDSLNDYVILNTKRFLDSLKDNKKEQHPSSQDPDWNSDEEIDDNLQSKVIDEVVIQKFVEKLGDRPAKKTELLKPHEKRFLQDYFREKRLQEQEKQDQQANSASVKTEKQKQTKPVLVNTHQQNSSISTQAGNHSQKNKTIWSEYQARQVNTFVDLGFMTKIEDNEEDISAEVVENDDMFKNDDEELKQSDSQKSGQSSEEQDDIFGDQSPTMTIKTKIEVEPQKQESQKKIVQGTVVVNEHIFSKIAQAIGLLPIRCNWIIKNNYNKFKVSTEYMDVYYRKEKMCEILPMISLNHSEFVSNDKVQTAEGMQILRDYNYRLNHNNSYQNNPRAKQQHYKQKYSTHLKKK